MTTKQLQLLIDAFRAAIPNVEFSFAHIVFSDFNLDNDSLSFARHNQSANLDSANPLEDWAVDATLEFLDMLRAIPEEVRENLMDELHGID